MTHFTPSSYIQCLSVFQRTFFTALWRIRIPGFLQCNTDPFLVSPFLNFRFSHPGTGFVPGHLRRNPGREVAGLGRIDGIPRFHRLLRLHHLRRLHSQRRVAGGQRPRSRRGKEAKELENAKRERGCRRKWWWWSKYLCLIIIFFNEILDRP